MADDPGYTVTNELPSIDVPEAQTSAPTDKCEQVIEAVLAAGATLWRGEDGKAYITLTNDNRISRHRVRSRDFRLVARTIYGQAFPVQGSQGMRPGSVPDSAMKEAILAFEAMAMTGVTRHPDVRIIEYEGAVWLDLGREDWCLIRVTDKGWKVVPKADVPLIRSTGIEPLPIPKPDQTALLKLRALLNIERETDFRLIVAWLVAALYPKGPFPLLALFGEQGSTKSNTGKTLRRLVDPNSADLRAPSQSERDLLIAARNSRVIAWDNVSCITPQLADALCRLATGAGFSTRQLYTDTEETIVSVSRPVLFTGIPNVLVRGDLADRAVAITLPPIAADKRLPESEIQARFDADAPGILALLLDGVAMALKCLPTLKLPRLPRMADFARLACAAAPAFGWTEDDMLAALESNHAEVVTDLIEASPFAGAVLRLAAAAFPEPLLGTATELLQYVNRVTGGDPGDERRWPRDATRFSNLLREVAPALRRVGVEVTMSRRPGGTRQIKIQMKGREKPNASSPAKAIIRCGIRIIKKSKGIIITGGRRR
jgi:hypothetical protein